MLAGTVTMAILIMTHTKNQTGVIQLCAKRVIGEDIVIVPEPEERDMHTVKLDANGKEYELNYEAIDKKNVKKLKTAIDKSNHKIEDFTTVFIEANYQYPGRKHFVKELFDLFLKKEGFSGTLVAVSATLECLEAASKHNERIKIYYKIKPGSQKKEQDDLSFKVVTTPQDCFKVSSDSKKKVRRKQKHGQVQNKKNRTPEYRALAKKPKDTNQGAQSPGCKQGSECSINPIRRTKTDPSKGFDESIHVSSSSDLGTNDSPDFQLPNAFEKINLNDHGSPLSKIDEKQPYTILPLYESFTVSEEYENKCKIPKIPISGLRTPPDTCFRDEDESGNVISNSSGKRRTRADSNLM